MVGSIYTAMCNVCVVLVILERARHMVLAVKACCFLSLSRAVRFVHNTRPPFDLHGSGLQETSSARI